ncbi:MAP kinase-activated protein kinase 2 (Fragment) [Seminavis robusta]|uniref:MAP kinase-activated protein kinase 2 n=1 Tax=Seminavis robusta TaxID=568900 RepID=A0A9N8DZU0_9STRA
MGGQQSKNFDDNSHDGGEGGMCSQNCGFLGNIVRITKRASMDLIGSPQPETPMHQRRKRAEVKKTLKKEVRSSVYGGLEKEVIPEHATNHEDLLEVSSTSSNAQVIVHEGPDCEKELQRKYQLMEVLGVGSTSTVHRCLNKDEDILCACKIIDKLQMEDRFAGMMAQFQTEVEALRMLQHPCIIQLYDVYLTEEKIYIVMEQMEGGELFDYVVQKGTLNEEEASKIVRRVTSALVYMHDKNIVHRDLKPENLLLKRKPRPTEDVEVKIIDFGLSKAMVEPVARTFLGTRGYLAPEMLQRREYTKAVDTWALGVIVFVLLCGCLPFDDDSSTVPSDDLVKAKFVLRFPRWASNLSASAKDLLSHLLDTDSRTRYTAEQALAHPWVRGQTAPRKNLLASPRRIRDSPHLRTPQSSKRKGATPNGRRKQQTHPAASPELSPKGPMVRKQSI